MKGMDVGQKVTGGGRRRVVCVDIRRVGTSVVDTRRRTFTGVRLDSYNR